MNSANSVYINSNRLINTEEHNFAMISGNVEIEFEDKTTILMKKSILISVLPQAVTFSIMKIKIPQ